MDCRRAITPGNDCPLCFIPSARHSSAGTGAPGRSQTVRAAGPVLSTDIITPLVWNDGQPLPEEESRLEVEMQEQFQGRNTPRVSKAVCTALCQAEPARLAVISNRGPGPVRFCRPTGMALDLSTRTL